MTAPRRHRLGRWIAARAWWRWQTAAVIAGLMMSGAAFFGALSGYIDERSDVADAQTARLRDQRADFEAECRFRLSSTVTGIEGEQIDGLTDLLDALAADDETRARAVIADLQLLKIAKDQAETARKAAVETCNRRSRDLYPAG